MSFERSRTPDALRLLAAGLLLVACGGAAEPEPVGPGANLDASDELAEDVAPPAPAVPDGAPTVLVLSDSIGAGLHLAEHQAFPAVLQRRLAADGAPFHLVNASESGRTSAGGVGALDWTLRGEPDVVVIGLGGNDGLRGVPVDEVEANVRAMVEGAQAAGARVLLLGVRIPENYGDYAEELAAVYPALAEELGAALVPDFMAEVGLVPELNLADGLHPNPEGHERLADAIEPALRALLAELDAPGG